MKKNIILFLVLILLIAGGYYFTREESSEGVMCTMEAKMCPGGSYVGRSGPRCEFADCPSASTGNSAKIDQVVLIGDIYITPLSVVSDSRCPIDVQCIQAGTVTILARLNLGTIVEEKEITLNEETIFEGKKVSLVSVKPATNSKKQIEQSQYEFEFLVK